MRLIDDLARLADVYHDGRSLALFFDFDGTLAPLVTHPDFAVCPQPTLDVLAALANLPRVQAGVISGRALADLKSKISLPNLVYAGTCGLELELGDRLIVHPQAAGFTPVLAAAAEVAAATAAPFAGAWIEHKPLAIAVHYRQVRRGETILCAQCLMKALSRFDGALCCLEGSLANDVLPVVNWEKGAALEAILAHVAEDAVPLYSGNDARDARAMAAATKRGGVSIGVGPEAPPEAEHRLADVDALTEQFAELLCRLQRA